MRYSNRKRRKTVSEFLRENVIKIAMIFAIILIFIACFIYRAYADHGDVSKEAVVDSILETVEQTPHPYAWYTGDIEYKHEKYPGTTVITDDPRVYIMAQLIWGEARGVPSTTEQAAVAWCVLNRVDDPAFPDTIEGVILQDHQFEGYSSENPAEEEFIFLASDVIHRWREERDGHPNAGRVLPKSYLYFEGDGLRNWFSEEWSSCDFFDWSLPSPYED